jgi:two-component system response regulator YesN
MRFFYRDISAVKMSKAFGKNNDYFNRLIKAHAGMTYSGFLHQIRLEAAEHLLRTTALPVEEIAEEIGYHNITYFYHIFLKKYGTTPNNFRKTQQN